MILILSAEILSAGHSYIMTLYRFVQAELVFMYELADLYYTSSMLDYTQSLAVMRQLCSTHSAEGTMLSVFRYGNEQPVVHMSTCQPRAGPPLGIQTTHLKHVRRPKQ